jgi:hypothetical protein
VKKRKTAPPSDSASKGSVYLKAIASAQSASAPLYPIELVAGVAVHLIKDRDYRSAARDALQLIDACKGVILEYEAERRDKVAESVLSAQPLVPFRKAVRSITGEDRLDRAEEKFYRFVREELSQDDVIALKKSGLSWEILAGLKEDFEVWWSRSKREARSKGAKARHLTRPKRQHSGHELTKARHE